MKKRHKKHKIKRTIVYIDGFNLYYGLRAKKLFKYLWLNLYDLARRIKPPKSRLVAVKYFTTRQGNPPEKHKRQKTFIEALQEYTPIQVSFGMYKTEKKLFKDTGCIHKIPREKKTDVNIAVTMLSDAFKNKFDNYILISGDTDQVPTIETIKKYFPRKKFIAIFPPQRRTEDLIALSEYHFVIGESLLKRCLLPESVKKKDGYTLKKPQKWS